MHMLADQVRRHSNIAQSSPLEEMAALFATLGHPVRLRLLTVLSQEEECVCHLVALLGRPQPYVSQQLAELRDAGLVVDRREGQRIFYRVADRRVVSILQTAGLVAERRQSVPGCPCPKCS